MLKFEKGNSFPARNWQNIHVGFAEIVIPKMLVWKRYAFTAMRQKDSSGAFVLKASDGRYYKGWMDS